MAADYTNFVELAQELIAEFGREVQVQKLSSTAPDPSKPWKSTGAVDQTRTVPAVFVPATGSDLGQMVTNEELLSRVDKVALVAPTDISLEEFDVILEDGARWNIDWAQVLKPGPTIVLYAFGVKR